MSQDEPVEVFRGTRGALQAEFFQSLLREQGIDSYVRSSTSIAAHPMSVGPMAEFGILVAPEHAARAREHLEWAVVNLPGAADDDADDEIGVEAVTLTWGGCLSGTMRVFLVLAVMALGATLVWGTFAGDPDPEAKRTLLIVGSVLVAVPAAVGHVRRVRGRDE